MPFDLQQIDVPFRMQPGLRKMAPDERHLSALVTDSPLLHAKRRVVANGASTLCMPGFDPCDAIDAIWRQAQADGAALPDRNTPLALAFEQDLAVLDLASGCVPWMCVCVPSGWAPEDKIGRDLTAIHAPVADRAALAARWPQMLRLLAGGASWERHVWTISPSPYHDRHPRRLLPVAWPDTDDAGIFASRCFLRTERQTFFPVAGRDLTPPRQLVFTITVGLQPLPDAVRQAADAARLLQSLQSMSDAVLAYKQLAPARAALTPWLERLAAG
jgi:dimethylamine monooxygenase subunit A